MLYKELENAFLTDLLDDMNMYENVQESRELNDTEYTEYQIVLCELAKRNYFRNECSVLDTETEEENEIHAKRMNAILDTVFIDSLFDIGKEYEYTIERNKNRTNTGTIRGTEIFDFIQTLPIKEGIDVEIKGNNVLIYCYDNANVSIITIKDCI